MGKRKTTEQFIEEAKAVHGEDTYDYSLSEYIDCNTKIIIQCHIHGIFYQKPSKHLEGQGCCKCGRQKIGIKYAKPQANESLLDLFPELCFEWSDKNALLPSECKYASNKKVYWECRKCNNVWLARINDRTRGRGCFKCRNTSSKTSIYDGLHIPKAHFNNIKSSLNRGSRKKLEFKITVEYIDLVFSKQNYKCVYTNQDLRFDIGSKRGNASVDRIDSSKGYIVDNIQIVHKVINNMKQALSHDEFLEWCRRIVEHQQILATAS